MRYQIEKDYKTLKINDKNDKSNVVKLSEQKISKNLLNSINLLNKKLGNIKKKR